MKTILKITALLLPICFFEKSDAQNEWIVTDTSSSTFTLAEVTNSTLLNNSPCNALYFDKEVLSMEADHLRESYSLLFEKYDNLKSVIKLYQKVIEEYSIVPSEQPCSCSNTISLSAHSEDAFIEPVIPYFSNENTAITYFIPDGARDTKLCITDSDGKLLLEYSLNSTGYGQVIIPGGKLNQGIFNYCLLLGNIKVECKKMIVMKKEI